MNTDYTAFDGSAYFSRTIITVPQKYLPLAYLLGLKSLEVTRFSMASFLPSHRHCASKLTARRVPKPIITLLSITVPKQITANVVVGIKSK